MKTTEAGMWEKYYRYMERVWEVLGFKPTEAQRPFFYDTHRVRLLAGGERAGKSQCASMDGFLRSAFTIDGKPGLFWIVGPDYVQARKEFTYIMEYYKKMGHEIVTLSTPSGVSQPWYMETALGTVWQTKTSSDIKKLASEALDGVLMVEAAQQSWEIYLKLRGRVAERRGWVTLSGTFEHGLTWYAQAYEMWESGEGDGKSFSVPTWSNTAIYPGGREDPEIKALEESYPRDLFEERFGAKPRKPAGLVFKEFSVPLHVRDDVMFNPELPVQIAVDPGYTGAYACLAIQEVGKEVHVVDEVYVRYGVAHDVIDEAKSRPWWSNVTGGVIDVAGLQHQGLPSHVEIWEDYGGVSLRSQPVSIEDGIALVRVFLMDPRTKRPRLYFSSSLENSLDYERHPTGILAEFGRYVYPKRLYKEALSETKATDRPVDRYNHAVKALGYYLFDRYGFRMQGRTTELKVKKRSYWR